LPRSASGNAAVQEKEEVLAEGSLIQNTKLFLPMKIRSMLWLKEGDRVEYVQVGKRIYIRKKE